VGGFARAVDEHSDDDEQHHDGPDDEHHVGSDDDDGRHRGAAGELFGLLRGDRGLLYADLRV